MRRIRCARGVFGKTSPRDNQLDSKKQEYTHSEISIIKAPWDRVLDPEFTKRYELRDELGSGGFGFVVSAVQTGVDNIAGVEVAVKFIFKERVNTVEWGTIGGEPVESYVLARCQHRGVIGFVGLYQDDEFFYLVSSSTSTDSANPGRFKNSTATLGNLVIHSSHPACRYTPPPRPPKSSTSHHLLAPTLRNRCSPRPYRPTVISTRDRGLQAQGTGDQARQAEVDPGLAGGRATISLKRLNMLGSQRTKRGSSSSRLVSCLVGSAHQADECSRCCCLFAWEGDLPPGLEGREHCH